MSTWSPSNLQALLGDFTQDSRLLQLTTPLGRNRLIVECVRGEEGIGQGFRLQISTLSTDAGTALKSLVGQPALLQLLTAAGRDERRPFHGYITAVELSGANGGLARYQLTLEPWTAFLARGRDSRVFQNMTVFNILDCVFAPWQGKGRLAPAWRFDIAERAAYPVRSLTTQHQESDLAFAERLMSEEGLFHYFKHAADPDSPSLGIHLMVIADHNGSFRPGTQANINFTQSGAAMKQDGIDRWRTELRQQANGVDISSWEYRTLHTLPAKAEHLLQALMASREVHVAAGTVRTLSPGSTFTLHGHARFDSAGDDSRSFAVVRAVHLMHNNLSAALKAEVNLRLQSGELAAALEREGAQSLHAVGAQAGERPLYRVRIDAIRRSTPFNARGEVRFPHAGAKGQQSAVVVGAEDSAIYSQEEI